MVSPWSARTTSPTLRPARAAGLSGATVWITMPEAGNRKPGRAAHRHPERQPRGRRDWHGRRSSTQWPRARPDRSGWRTRYLRFRFGEDIPVLTQNDATPMYPHSSGLRCVALGARAELMKKIRPQILQILIVAGVERPDSRDSYNGRTDLCAQSTEVTRIPGGGSRSRGLAPDAAERAEEKHEKPWT